MHPFQCWFKELDWLELVKHITMHTSAEYVEVKRVLPALLRR